jgi:hypothetical protein
LCCFLSQVNKERNGIEIAFEPGKKLDAVENLISGAVILFSDIYGVDMDPTTSAPVEVGTIPEVVNALFSFSLVTREDVLQFRFMEEGGGPWLSAIRWLCWWRKRCRTLHVHVYTFSIRAQCYSNRIRYGVWPSI